MAIRFERLSCSSEVGFLAVQQERLELLDRRNRRNVGAVSSSLPAGVKGGGTSRRRKRRGRTASSTMFPCVGCNGRLCNGSLYGMLAVLVREAVCHFARAVCWVSLTCHVWFDFGNSSHVSPRSYWPKFPFFFFPWKWTLGFGLHGSHLCSVSVSPEEKQDQISLKDGITRLFACLGRQWIHFSKKKKNHMYPCWSYSKLQIRKVGKCMHIHCCQNEVQRAISEKETNVELSFTEEHWRTKTISDSQWRSAKINAFKEKLSCVRKLIRICNVTQFHVRIWQMSHLIDSIITYRCLVASFWVTILMCLGTISDQCASVRMTGTQSNY